MFHMYEGNHWMGMHLFWWMFWLTLLAAYVGRAAWSPRGRGRPRGRW